MQGEKPVKKTTRGIIMDHLKQTEQERRILVSSLSRVSEWQLGHNKGMRKAYNTLLDDLDRHGLIDDPPDTCEEESI